jgi:hypothetical protein
MCGDIESETPLEQQIVEHFRSIAGQYLAAAGTGVGTDPQHDYMDRLFAAVLRECLDDLDEAGSGAALDRLQAQGVVLARLAGILTGQLPPVADGLHAATDALLVGYGEARGDRDDGHDHGHGHGHHHHH